MWCGVACSVIMWPGVVRHVMASMVCVCAYGVVWWRAVVCSVWCGVAWHGWCCLECCGLVCVICITFSGQYDHQQRTDSRCVH